MEKSGVPAAVICTRPFLEQSKAMAVTHGFIEYPFVEVFHPIATASPVSLQAEAERVTDEVLGLLLNVRG
ncbi:hypothetical protein EDD64_1314 [Effusibacillus lacus]|nr:hypothetical protein EDD64_1314 [Effusibacillus lacus]